MYWFIKVNINILAPGIWSSDFLCLIIYPVTIIDILKIFSEITFRWMPQHFTDNKSTLVKVMAWCHQATSHYLNQCWPNMGSPGINELKDNQTTQLLWCPEWKQRWQIRNNEQQSSSWSCRYEPEILELDKGRSQHHAALCCWSSCGLFFFTKEVNIS